MTAVGIYRSNWIELPGIAMPAGRLIAAIGDVHGMIEQARALVDALRADFGDRADGACIWLGDYVDRGPDSAACLDLAAAGLRLDGIDNVCLLGNHEVLMMDCLGLSGPVDREAAAIWLSNGGGQTLESLGLPRKIARSADLAPRLRDALGPRRLDFLSGLALSHREGDLLFVHAGVDPLRPLDRQDEEELVWIREPFLRAHLMPEGVVVVHGHSIAEPGVRSGLDVWRPGAGRPARVGVDGGCYRSGTLTAAQFLDGRVRFVHAMGQPAF